MLNIKSRKDYKVKVILTEVKCGLGVVEGLVCGGETVVLPRPSEVPIEIGVSTVPVCGSIITVLPASVVIIGDITPAPVISCALLTSATCRKPDDLEFADLLHDLALLVLSTRLLSCSCVTSAKFVPVILDVVIYCPLTTLGSILVTTIFRSLSKLFLLAAICAALFGATVIDAFILLNVVELRFRVRLPIGGMAIDIGLFVVVLFIDVPPGTDVVNIVPVAGFGEEPERFRFMPPLLFVLPPVNWEFPKGDLFMADPSVADPRLELNPSPIPNPEPEPTGLRPPDDSLGLIVRLIDADLGFDLLAIFDPQGEPPAPPSPIVNSYGSLEFVMICEPCGSFDSTQSFLQYKIKFYINTLYSDNIDMLNVKCTLPSQHNTHYILYHSSTKCHLLLFSHF